MDEKVYDIYIVTATGTKNGQAYSALAPVVRGTKENGDRYTFVDANAKTKRDTMERKFGSIVYFDSVEVEATDATTAVKKIALPQK
jgi:hypothetical protein